KCVLNQRSRRMPDSSGTTVRISMLAIEETSFKEALPIPSPDSPDEPESGEKGGDGKHHRSGHIKSGGKRRPALPQRSGIERKGGKRGEAAKDAGGEEQPGTTAPRRPGTHRQPCGQQPHGKGAGDVHRQRRRQGR